MLLGCTLMFACSHAGPAGSAEDSGAVAASIARGDTTDAEFEGTDDRGVPHYALTRAFSAEDSALLLHAYGIENPHHLYVSDSTKDQRSRSASELPTHKLFAPGWRDAPAGAMGGNPPLAFSPLLAGEKKGHTPDAIIVEVAFSAAFPLGFVFEDALLGGIGDI